jgi:hypothetical protein
MGELEKHLAQSTKPRKERDTDEMGTLLARALGGADRFDIAVIKWPGRDDVTVGLRLLSDFDIAEADSSARAWAEATRLNSGKERLDDREYTARYGAECVARSLVHPETKQRLVGTADELRKLATREEIDALSVALSDHQEALAPFPYQLSDEEVERLAEAVKRPDPFRERALSTCAPSTLRRCIRALVAQLAKSPGSQSSPSTAPTGTT